MEMKAHEIIQKQMRLLLDVSEKLQNNSTDRDSVELLCVISRAMADLTVALPDELR